MISHPKQNVKQNPTSHTPVLIDEICCALMPEKGGIFIDGTFGAGGYTQKLLEKGATHVYAIDQDEAVQPFVEKTQQQYPEKLTFYQGNFVNLLTFLPESIHGNVQGVVLDLGVSSMQLCDPARGFSFLHDGPLDMRMSSQNKTTAGDVLNKASEQKLADIFFFYGEEPKARMIAKSIVRQRRQTPWKTTKQLAALVCNIYSKQKKWSKKHPATKVFQGLRIYINRELDFLKDVLVCALEILAVGGRLGVVSFHSLEDRIIKHFFKEHKPLTKKPLTPSVEEINYNPSARSAKLRVLEKNEAFIVPHALERSSMKQDSIF